MWLRFESYYRHQCTRWATGIFTMIREVLEDPAVSPETKQRIRTCQRWFGNHLPAPEPKDIDPRAIFWFRAKRDLSQPARVSPWKRRPLTKLAARTPRVRIPADGPIDATEAAEAIARMQEFVQVILEGNLHIRIVETTRPGYIIFEDAYQIAAIPFKDAIEEHQLTLAD